MNASVQTIAALAIVAVTIVLLLRGALRKRKQPGCGGDCACPTDEIKAQLAKTKPRSR
jgi:hypothetical protein